MASKHPIDALKECGFVMTDEAERILRAICDEAVEVGDLIPPPDPPLATAVPDFEVVRVIKRVLTDKIGLEDY